MLPNNKNKRRGFTLLELIITIAIIVIMAGALVSMMGSFGHRRELEVAAVKLLGDLRQTQEFARVQKDGYKYYGLRFYGNLGEDGDRDGWKIVRYEPPENIAPIDFVPPVDFNRVTVIKSSDPDDNSGYGAQLLENTFFGKGVGIDSGVSEFQVAPGGGEPIRLHSIVFTPEGSATKDGAILLTNDNDEIVLNLVSRYPPVRKTVIITPLTGHVRMQ